MKYIIHIIFALASIGAFGQQPDGASQSSVLDFVDQNIGKKVGKGVCFDLVRKAFEQSDRQWFDKWEHKSKYKISRAEVQPGDVMVFYNCKFSDGFSSGYHVGILMSADSLIIEIANQNVGHGPKKKVRSYGRKVFVQKNSSVELRYVDLSLLVKGRVEFYRF